MEEMNQNMHNQMEDEGDDIEEIESEVIDVWDEDEFAPRGEDFLPLSVSVGQDKGENPDAVMLILESVDANFSVRLHKEELKQIAHHLNEACKEL